MSQTASPQENCPAFADGCPYPKAAQDVSQEEKAALAMTNNCPAFQDGCPFNVGDTSVAGMAEKLQSMPASHAEGGDLAPAVAGALKAVHTASIRVRDEQLGGTACPVLLQGCPFKGAATTTGGAPLVSELDVRLWFEAGDDGKEEGDDDGAEG
eukprot:CAMPEP_0118864012 /NCGR_PEP_ID=MMETSP1163-20130328/8703_1 /TAXON_ID=124430 /ORGANISM="Phaeomonas parva, Strain CCMP2877" /LENGTH=153 /DNA_ID=CAMNT_0006798079 /DNA_START=73 /DNA_END=530 /DNA_ORIENTATION=+